MTTLLELYNTTHPIDCPLFYYIFNGSLKSTISLIHCLNKYHSSIITTALVMVYIAIICVYSYSYSFLCMFTHILYSANCLRWKTFMIFVD